MCALKVVLRGADSLEPQLPEQRFADAGLALALGALGLGLVFAVEAILGRGAVVVPVLPSTFDIEASVGGIGFVCVAPAVGQAKVLPAFARAVLTLLHALSAAPPAANGLDRARLADELAALLHGHGGSATRLSDAALVKLFRLLRLARRLLDLQAGEPGQES